jgi:general secretion pathway protein D
MSMRRTRHHRPFAASLIAGALLVPTLPVAVAQSSDAPRTAAPRFRGEPVTLNFVSADIEAVARAMGAILKQQFVVDPRVRGQMTLYSEQPLAPNEAYLSFLAGLRGLGFTVVEVGGLFKVVPEADAKLQTGTVAIGETPRRGDQILTQIFKLNHESANNLVPILRPLISPNNTINANPGNNSLVITDYADNLQRIAKIVAAMDIASAGDVEVVPLQYAVAADLAPLVQRLTDAGGASAVPGVPAAPGGVGGAQNAAQVIPDSRSNALIIRAASPARMATIRGTIEKLDRPLAGAAATGNLWVVHLKNADATKLATVLRAAFGGGGGSSGSSPSPLSSLPATPAAPGATAGASPQATAPVAAGAGPSTGGFIQADPSTNSLIITAPEPLYRQVRAMIEQLDSRRAQVYIESMIVEVSGSNAADFGFQWQGLIGKDGDKYGVIGGTNFNSGNTSGNNILSITQAAAGGTAIAIGEGLNLGLVKNFAGTYALASIARLLQSQTATNIISTPNLITLDNEEAKIIVGSNVPFITGQFTQTGTAATNPFQTIERKDVGITLRIKPQIGEGGTVRMTIYQESSSVARETAPGTSNAGPTTNKRSIESTVVVDDGAILVLGGLIEDSFTDTKAKVPLLGDIPGIGALFRSETREKRRTNLMVFLRPVIMRTPEDASRLSLDRYDVIRARQSDAQPSQSVILGINDAPLLPASPPAAPASAAAARPAAPAPVGGN